MKGKKISIIWITRTAVLIALTVTLQAVTLQLGNQYVTGSIVNMMLILSCLTCGLTTGLTVSAVSPILPTLMGFGPLPVIVPFIIAGNISLMVIWHIFARTKNNRLIAIIIGAVVKFGVLYIGIVKLAAPYILKVQESHPIMLLFSYPQLFTALIGGTLAVTVLPILKKLNLNNKNLQ